jgi:hypothetical protein
LKIYVIESRSDGDWTLCNRCFTSYDAAAAEANAITVESHAANDWKFSAYIHSIELVDDLQAYAEQRRGDNTDNVNHPAHYTNGEIECIDAIRAALTVDEFRGYVKGNVIKYAFRERMKGGDEDLAKARWYLSELLESEVRDD